jgi:hypothetical protein
MASTIMSGQQVGLPVREGSRWAFEGSVWLRKHGKFEANSPESGGLAFIKDVLQLPGVSWAGSLKGP